MVPRSWNYVSCSWGTHTLSWKTNIHAKLKTQSNISSIVFVSVKVLVRIKYLRNSEEIVVVWAYSEYAAEKDKVCSASENIC